MRLAPLGINLDGYAARRAPRSGPFTIGYFARVAPEKGLHVLCEAYRRLRAKRPVRTVAPRGRRISGARTPGISRRHRSGCCARRGLESEFEYRGEVDRAQKIAFLQSLDVMSVPATYEEPKGIFLLEAMASGVPVVQPRRGAFPEIVEKTGGGLIVDADDPDALADGLLALWRDPARAAALGAAGAAGVREHYTVGRMAEDVGSTIYRRDSIDAPSQRS